MPISGINFEWMLIIIIGIVGMLVQGRLQSVFAKYSRVRTSNGMTGRDVAEKMLRDNGIYDVQVISTPGHLTDHYNPANKTVNLSESVYNSPSIAAAAVASHECGHAVQHARGYVWVEMRTRLVPLISITSRFSTWVIIIGILTINIFPALFWIGILMIAASALFSIITLPVEYNASARALDWLRSTRTLDSSQMEGATISLRWAARTYLVAALSAIATLLYYLGFARSSSQQE